MVHLMGGFPPQGEMDPNAFAAQFASQNGISLDDAKAQLRAKFGDPQQPQNFMKAGLQQYYQPTPQGVNGGLPAQGDPNGFAQQYANEKGISLDDAKAELKGKHGNPETTLTSTTTTSAYTYLQPMPDHREVHNNDKQWLREFHRSHPGTSKADARNAFYAQYGRMPE